MNKRQKAEILAKYNHEMETLNECAKILAETTDPAEFFPNYDLYMEKLKILSEAESSGIVSVSGDSFCEKYEQKCANNVEDVNEFIDRVWAKTNKNEEEYLKEFDEYIVSMPYDSIPHFLSLVIKQPKYTASGLDIRVVEATLAQKENILKNGFTHYEYIASPDSCPKCKELDGKIFPLSELKVGTNAPPMCRNCRCTISPNTGMSDEDYEAWLDSYHIHKLSFEDWKRMKKNENE